MKKIKKFWNLFIEAMTAGNAYITGGEQMLNWHLDQKTTA